MTTPTTLRERLEEYLAMRRALGFHLTSLMSGGILSGWAGDLVFRVLSRPVSRTKGWLVGSLGGVHS